jgi:hypothetical protein
MRHTVLAGLVGLAAVVTAVFMAPQGGARIARAAEPPGGTAGPAGPQTKIIEYYGVRFGVPARWPVYRLDQEPSRCVRYDRHAVYLGRAGADQDCPARMAGRTETLQVEPLDSPPSRTPEIPEAPGAPSRDHLVEPADPPRQGRPARPALTETPVGPSETPGAPADEEAREVAREVDAALPAAGLRMTGTYGSDRALLDDVLRSVRVRPGVRRALPSLGTPGPDSGLRIAVPYRPFHRLPDGRGGHRTWATGRGFDACTAPSLAAMHAWRGTYRVANIYIGGASRGCAQPNLTRHWVGSVRRMGYRLIPTYVGLQAPCSAYHTRFTAKNAYRKGRASADDAVHRARALGVPRGEPIYFDMEGYPTERAPCRRAVHRFMHAWSRRVPSRGYVAGMYGSAGAGVQDIGEATGITKPEAIWFARWDGKARTAGGRYLRRSWWNPHRRIKQYRGGHRERHGGYTLNVDSNAVDGLVF